MSDRWEALRAWLKAERDKAGEASRQAAAAMAGLMGTATATDWSAAVKAADEANARCAALREVAQKMADLERGQSRPRLRDTHR